MGLDILGVIGMAQQHLL